MEIDFDKLLEEIQLEKPDTTAPAKLLDQIRRHGIMFLPVSFQNVEHIRNVLEIILALLDEAKKNDL